MRGQRMHWRSSDNLSQCGRGVEARLLASANVEAVTCGNCLRTREVQYEVSLSRVAVDADLPF